MRVRKRLRSFLNRLFHAKRVIVVSEKSVDYYPLGKFTQIVLFAGVIGGASWASYSTGGFMAARTLIAEKDRRIEEASIENQKIENQFSLLRKDIVRLNEGEEKELSEYSKFVIGQYADGKLGGFSSLPAEGIAVAGGQNMMHERLRFLEDRLEQLKQENHDLVETIQSRTRDKISEFEDIINMTGLSSRALEHRPQASRTETGDAGEDIASRRAAGLPRGGPYVPLETYDMDSRRRAALDLVDRMMHLYEIIGALPLAKPVQAGEITSGYGRRIDPFHRRWARHLGVDFVAPAGGKVYATSGGIVKFSGRRGAYGNLVELDHGMGVTTRYGHLSKILVKEGQKIAKGEAIGVQGSTGRSTGPHVHYEVRYHKKTLNPLNFIRAGRHVPEIN